MSAPFTFEDLKEILVHHGGVDPARIVDDPSLSLEELGIGSLAMLAIQLDLSQRFDLRLTEADLPQLATVGSFLRFVENRRRAGKGS